jgi:prefoldin subunit 5
MPCAPTLKDERIAQLEQQVQQLTQECATLQRVIDTLRPK